MSPAISGTGHGTCSSISTDRSTPTIEPASVDAGISEVGVDYWAFNTRASQFFASLGFEPQHHIAFAPVTPAG